MKGFVSITLAFAAFSGIVLITSVIAQTSAVVAQTRENEASKPPPRGLPLSSRELASERHRRADAPSQCAPDDRKCEVERKLKGRVSDPVKGKGF